MGRPNKTPGKLVQRFTASVPPDLFDFIEEQRKAGRRAIGRSAYILRLIDEEKARVARRAKKD